MVCNLPPLIQAAFWVMRMRVRVCGEVVGSKVPWGHVRGASGDRLGRLRRREREGLVQAHPGIRNWKCVLSAYCLPGPEVDARAQ